MVFDRKALLIRPLVGLLEGLRHKGVWAFGVEVCAFANAFQSVCFFELNCCLS